MSPKEFNELLNKPDIRKRNPDCNQGTDSKLEPAIRNDALATTRVESKDSSKFLVRVTSYRTRLLDEDNLAEKYHVDTCRYAGLLPSDAPGETQIETAQQKVKSKDEERTEIVIMKLAQKEPA